MANDFLNQPDQPNGRRDLFLSYNSRDRAAVVRVRQLLGERKISTFFDRDQLRAGSRWVNLLEDEVGRSRAVAIFIGPHGLGDWQEMEMQLALVRQIDEKKDLRPFPVIPLILPGAAPEKELGFLKLYTWVDLRARLDDPTAIDELERAVRGGVSTSLGEAAVEMCPYRALQAFREQDEKLFFGRERFADQLLEKARDQKLKLIAVVGPSGSRKSSVVQAGLIPRLRREVPPRSSWEAAIFTPGKAPFHNLAAALITVGAAEQDRWERLGKAEKLGRDLVNGDVRPEAAITTALAEARGANRLLLIVDQAEELFTLTTEEDRRPFIHRLLAAAETAPVTIALTLRADFYGQAIGYSRELGELITRGQVNILPMSRDELRQAIVAPAGGVELKFEEGLVDRILDHIENEPGNLPLLEFALTELWNRRQGKTLRNDAYKDIGGVEGAISRRAEEQFRRLSREQRESAQRALTRLVRVSAATEEGTDTRQRIRLSELDSNARDVVRTFADARLLVTNRIEIKNEKTGAEESEEVVEVAHEALIRSWQDLKDLLNRDRQFLLWRQRLGFLMSECQRTGSAPGSLLNGPLLVEARRRRRERGQDLNEREKEFIASANSRRRRTEYLIAAAAALVVVSALAPISWKLWDNSPQSQINKILAKSPNLVKTATADSVSSIYLNFINAWLSALVLTGRSNEAFGAARLIEQSHYRAQALASLVEALAKAGETAEIKLVVAEALDTARKIEDASSRSQAMARLVEALAKVSETEGTKLATAEALDAARKTKDVYASRLNLGIIIRALAIAGKTDEALDTARKIEDASSRSRAMVDIGNALEKAGKMEEGRLVVAEALDAAREVEDPDYRSEDLASVVEALTKIGKTVEALGVVREIGNPHDQSKALFSVATALAKAGKTEEAIESARKIEDEETRVLALGSIFEILVNGRETTDKARSVIEAAKQAAEQISKEYVRSAALANVATGLAKLHLYRQARELVDLNNTSAKDKLVAYTAILREYYIEHHPDQAKLFEK